MVATETNADSLTAVISIIIIITGRMLLMHGLMTTVNQQQRKPTVTNPPNHQHHGDDNFDEELPFAGQRPLKEAETGLLLHILSHLPMNFSTLSLLGGSWVVISRAISRVTLVITHIKGLITSFITTPEPSSRFYVQTWAWHWRERDCLL